MGRPFVTTGGGYAPRSVFVDLTCDEPYLNLSDEEDYDIGDEENEDPADTRIRFRVEETTWSVASDSGSVARRRGRFAGIDGSGIELRSLDGVSGYGDQEGDENLGIIGTPGYFSVAGQTVQSTMDQTGVSSSENRIR